MSYKEEAVRSLGEQLKFMENKIRLFRMSLRMIEWGNEAGHAYMLKDDLREFKKLIKEMELQVNILFFNEPFSRAEIDHLNK